MVLRAITTMARLSLPMDCPRKSSILVSEMELRPLAGLLVNISDGPATSVCVTVMCRRRLLESRCGHVPVPLVTLMSLSRRTVPVWVLPWDIPLRTSGRAIPLSMASDGTRPKRRKTTVTPWCSGSSWFLLSASTAALPKAMALSAGCRRMPTACISADPLVLEKLTTLHTEFPPTARDMLLMVWKWPPLWLNLMAMRLSETRGVLVVMELEVLVVVVVVVPMAVLSMWFYLFDL